MARRRKNRQQTSPQFVETDSEILEYQRRQMVLELRDAVMREIKESNDYDDPDESEWFNGTTVPISGKQFEMNLWEFRKMARTPYGKRILDLYRYYVTTDVCVKLCPKDDEKASKADSEDPKVKAFSTAVERWEEENEWFSHGEVGVRRYGEGECLIWRSGPGKYRIVDPENLMTTEYDHLAAIDTEPLDVVSVNKYILTRKQKTDAGVEERVAVSEVPPEDFLMLKYGSNSSEKRGTSIFEFIMKQLRELYRTENNEYMLRLGQSAITKVVSTTGGSTAVSRLMNQTKSSNTTAYDNISSTEKVREGTTFYKGNGVDVKYTHPDNNFSDASPLIAWFERMLAIATGWAHHQISADVSDGNLASMTISEGPVAEMIKAEREEHEKLAKLYRWIADDAGLNIDWDAYEIEFEFKPLTSMEPLKSAQTVNLSIMNQTMSRKTARVRQDLDPDYEEKQIESELESGIYNAGFNNQNSSQDNQKQSSQQNGAQGSGGNQGSMGSPDSMGK